MDLGRSQATIMMTGSGDDRAQRFRSLALPLLEYLHRLALALTGNRPRAEDLTQETMLRALRYFDSYQGDDFRAWIATIMRNLYRTRTPPAPISTDDEWFAELADPAPNPEQAVMADDRAARLRRLVAALPLPLREVLVMREFGELTYTQIADALAVPVGTVMSRLSRARDNLRTSWLTAYEGSP